MRLPLLLSRLEPGSGAIELDRKRLIRVADATLLDAEQARHDG